MWFAAHTHGRRGLWIFWHFATAVYFCNVSGIPTVARFPSDSLPFFYVSSYDLSLARSLSLSVSVSLSLNAIKKALLA